VEAEEVVAWPGVHLCSLVEEEIWIRLNWLAWQLTWGEILVMPVPGRQHPQLKTEELAVEERWDMKLWGIACGDIPMAAQMAMVLASVLEVAEEVADGLWGAVLR
jgi:hypothetical protein